MVKPTPFEFMPIKVYFTSFICWKFLGSSICCSRREQQSRIWASVLIWWRNTDYKDVQFSRRKVYMLYYLFVLWASKIHIAFNMFLADGLWLLEESLEEQLRRLRSIGTQDTLQANDRMKWSIGYNNMDKWWNFSLRLHRNYPLYVYCYLWSCKEVDLWIFYRNKIE